MNTQRHPAHITRLFQVAFVFGLLLLALRVSDAQTIFFGSGGTGNTAPNTDSVALGYGALYSNTTGSINIAIGNSALFSNTTGSKNTAVGYNALNANTTGHDNTANGWESLFSNTIGEWNTANGSGSLYSNTTGNYNSANGYSALYANTTGYLNTANGYEALVSNTTGTWNTANGANALASNTTGIANSADGYAALAYNTGSGNTANGYEALVSNTTGNYNTANGLAALNNNTTGSYNIAIGYGAGQNLTTGSNNIDIGHVGKAGEAGTIRIGTPGMQTAAYIAGISGVTATGGTAVYITSSGQLGTLTSSRRFKKDIQDMGLASRRLMQLRPVTFHYKQAAEDGNHPLQYGLIAEEVAKVYPDLVQYDKQGKPFAVYYHLLTPMLLNELQKQHHRSDAQKTEIAALKSEVAALKQSQEQQQKALAKLTALVEASQVKAQHHQAVTMRH